MGHNAHAAATHYSSKHIQQLRADIRTSLEPLSVETIKIVLRYLDTPYVVYVSYPNFPPIRSISLPHQKAVLDSRKKGGPAINIIRNKDSNLILRVGPQDFPVYQFSAGPDMLKNKQKKKSRKLIVSSFGIHVDEAMPISGAPRVRCGAIAVKAITYCPKSDRTTLQISASSSRCQAIAHALEIDYCSDERTCLDTKTKKINSFGGSLSAGEVRAWRRLLLKDQPTEFKK